MSLAGVALLARDAGVDHVLVTHLDVAAGGTCRGDLILVARDADVARHERPGRIGFSEGIDLSDEVLCGPKVVLEESRAACRTMAIEAVKTFVRPVHYLGARGG